MSDVSKHEDRIKALDFQAPNAANTPDRSSDKSRNSRVQTAPNATVLTARSGAPWWHSQFNLMLCVFALLAVAAGLLISLSPSPGSVVDQTNVIVTSDGSSNTAPATTNSSTQTAAPWDESRRAQARADSQDILASLLDSKKALEAKNVTEWAAERYQAAIDLANVGDELYKQQDYAQAISSYTAAAEQMDSLDELLPDVIKSKVKQGSQALDEGKAALAKQRFNEALSLDVNDISALTGLGRAEVLDQVLALASSALNDEQAFNDSDKLAELISAKDKYKQALDLDKEAPQALDGLTRVQSLIVNKEYRIAMSKGYQSLFARRYAAARSAFSTALKIKPSDATANAAYQQSLASGKRSSLTSLLSAAERYEKNEQWSSALSNYQVVLQRDPNQVNAKLGKIRSDVRSQLDARLDEALADPLALAKSTQKERVLSLLSDARGIQKKGPRLTQQIASIEAAMQQSNTVINVTFMSDEFTDVRLQKAGAKPLRLGKFSSRKLALNPGRYVVSGRREGFQDVRQEIVLEPGLNDSKTGVSFDVRCVKAVAARTN